MIKLSCLAVNLDDDTFKKLSSVRPYELTFSAVAHDFTEASVLLEKLIVQVVIVGVKGESFPFEFVDFLKKLSSRPIVAVITDKYDKYDGIAHVTFSTSENIPDVASKILAMPLSRKDNSLEITLGKEKLLDERLANIFISAGIPPHIKGYQFLREAVKQAVSDPSMINNITKMLYPAVAERFNTSPSKVERAIRHAIEVAWSRGKIENINNVYGIKIFSRGDKPTNGELIALVSDKLLIECS
ncbi:MAG: sporulation initiation factor Spo0A C-terminal domain-containing protein [Clostridia bacterium]|nr:sporulation initiation factor Spo0A C-terminal domain-containing protein [Clostridia bacterium]